MKNRISFLKILVGMALVFFIIPLHAGKPLWSFTPLSQTSITVGVNNTAQVSYQITNQSRKSHTLSLTPSPGITQATTPGHCTNPFVLGYQQSCILDLTIDGSTLPGTVTTGPIICEQGNPIQCYQPAVANRLNITRGTASSYTVGGTVSGLSGTLAIENNSSDSLVINSNGSFTFANPLPSGSVYSVTVFTQPAGQTCTVSNGNGNISNSNVTNISINCVLTGTVLFMSQNNLALSVTGLTEYGISGTPSSGLPRVITVSNIGSDPALNLSVNMPTWPAGTSSITDCGISLAPGDNCSITITPGNTATSDGVNPCSSGTGTCSWSNTSKCGQCSYCIS